MAKISKTVIDANLRSLAFEELDIEHLNFVKINDRQYGMLIKDLNGVERYIRVGAIVAEEREDMTARELMQKEIDDYKMKQAKKAEQTAAKKEKAERDKAKREEKKKEKEAV